jgi:demethylmenaquinone methyltransferase/2-methoxy-6-polyprenyl-1,4-benzoquinol methylase
LVQPYNKSKDKKGELRAMFNNIALNYDFLNHLLSFGIDVFWRKRLIRELLKYKSVNVLDMATGTADLAIMARRKGIEKLTGIDLSEKMIEVGKDKIQKYKLVNSIMLEVGDAENINRKSDTFDAAMVAFGVRNFANLKAGLNELNRVLIPGSPLFILEFSKPKVFPVKQLYHFYSFKLLPFIGRIISSDPRAYLYLPESIQAFPSGNNFIYALEECNYDDVRQIHLSFGIATIYIAHKALKPQ